MKAEKKKKNERRENVIKREKERRSGNEGACHLLKQVCDNKCILKNYFYRSTVSIIGFIQMA